MKKPNTTGIRVYVSTRLHPPKKPLALIFETRLPIPRVRALMIAYERLEMSGLSTVPVLAYDMSEPYADRGFGFVPRTYFLSPEHCPGHRYGKDGVCRICHRDVS